MQSLTVMWELKLNRPFCLQYQRHSHQLLLAVNCEKERLCADTAWMFLSIKQMCLLMFSVAFIVFILSLIV